VVTATVLQRVPFGYVYSLLYTEHVTVFRYQSSIADMPFSPAGLKQSLPTAKVITDADLLEQYRRDNSLLSPAGRPRAAVIAQSVEDVTSLLDYAHSRNVAVVTRGAGSGLSGGANALDGCIVLITTALDQIHDLNQLDMYATVQPGVLNARLKDRARETRLFYPPDPASFKFSTLGGNVATNAGGLCCVKYGVTGDYVMALDVVLADGTRAQTGSTARKSVAGYDLTSLMVGSEGTLGVIVSATLRLAPLAEAPATIVAQFDTMEKVGSLPASLAEAGITPSMLELVDGVTVSVIEKHFPMGLGQGTGAMIIAQADTPDRESTVTRIADIATLLGASETFLAADPIEGEMLVQGRRLAFTALEKEPGVALLDDVSVPISQIPNLIAEIATISARHGVRIGTFGHLGDGNLHPTLLYNPRDPDQVTRATAAFDAIVYAALNLGGSVTGEHGVGTLKLSHLEDQLGEPARRLHAEIKRTFDPKGILNPGKVIRSTTPV
jgi:glycolate oxidase